MQKDADIVFLERVDNSDDKFKETSNGQQSNFVATNIEGLYAHIEFCGNIDDLRKFPDNFIQTVFALRKGDRDKKNKAIRIKCVSGSLVKRGGVWTLIIPIGITFFMPDEQNETEGSSLNYHESKRRQDIRSKESRTTTKICQDSVTLENKLKKDSKPEGGLDFDVPLATSIKTEEANRKELTSIECSQSNLNKRQYVKAGRDSTNFFFEGSETDGQGAYFLIEYNDITKQGEFSLITSITNLRTINPGFLKNSIRIYYNGTSIKDAKGFTQIPHTGKVRYSLEDKVWMITDPVIIKLF
jgi:hypothetical protein